MGPGVSLLQLSGRQRQMRPMGPLVWRRQELELELERGQSGVRAAGP